MKKKKVLEMIQSKLKEFILNDNEHPKSIHAALKEETINIINEYELLIDGKSLLETYKIVNSYLFGIGIVDELVAILDNDELVHEVRVFGEKAVKLISRSEIEPLFLDLTKEQIQYSIEKYLSSQLEKSDKKYSVTHFIDRDYVFIIDRRNADIYLSLSRRGSLVADALACRIMVNMLNTPITVGPDKNEIMLGETMNRTRSDELVNKIKKELLLEKEYEGNEFAA